MKVNNLNSQASGGIVATYQVAFKLLELFESDLHTLVHHKSNF